MHLQIIPGETTTQTCDYGQTQHQQTTEARHLPDIRLVYLLVLACGTLVENV